MEKIGKLSPGTRARLGALEVWRVGTLRAVEDHSAPIPGEITSELGGIIQKVRVVRCAHSRVDQAAL